MFVWHELATSVGLYLQTKVKFIQEAKADFGIVVFGSIYSRMEQVKFVEDSL